MQRPPMQRPIDPLSPSMNGFGDSPYGAARPPTASPPGSNHPSSSTDMSRPSLGGGSSVGRPPSSASSIARSSDGRMGFGPPGQRDSTRGHVNPHNEDALQRHYGTLKTYLASALHDEKGNMKPNRARDKLLRLSVTQFMELSTDVYDELIRREDVRLQRVANVPPSLPPKNNFHPKRNQARQKLSTLPLERFKQLATDVYFELERRIPRFAAGDIDRPMSGASMRSTRGPPGVRGPPGPGGRPPMGPGPPGSGSFGPPPRAATTQGDFGRPFPKTFQSNTIVPNKGTMVEDDEDDEEDGYGALTGLSDRFSKNTNMGESNAEDKERIKSLESETTELKEKIEDLESKLLEKDQELERTQSASQERQNGVTSERETERSEWLALREELEEKHMDAQKLNENLRNELDQLHREKSQDEREIRSQHDRNIADMRTQIEDFHAQIENMHKQTDDLHKQLDLHRQENEDLRNQLQEGQQHSASSEEVERLREELTTQEKISSEVRSEAHMYLQEMRDLSRQNDAAIEQEEKLAAQVQTMEREIDEWRHRYAKVKAQNKHLRASTMGLGLQTSFDAGSLTRKEALLSDNGLVKDVDVTRFQLAVDELLKVARQTSTQSMLDSVKNVVVCVQSIASTVGTDGYPTPAPSPLSPDGREVVQPVSVGKLKARVTGTANSLITATKQHAAASGLSPVALLDAAASNLTASVVELIKAVGIRPSSKTELQDLEDDAAVNGEAEAAYDPHMSMSSFYNDEVSPTSDKPGVSISSPSDGHYAPPPLDVDAPLSSPSMTPEPLAKKPPPLGRSNTMKKWFGWGSRNVEEEDVPPTPRAVDGGSGEREREREREEYDPYR